MANATLPVEEEVVRNSRDCFDGTSKLEPCEAEEEEEEGKTVVEEAAEHVPREEEEG